MSPRRMGSLLHREQELRADIYALLWYSNTELPKLKNQLFSIYPEEEARKTVRTFTEEDINKVSQAIGASAKEISRILAELT
jgi:hypothetical protein